MGKFKGKSGGGKASKPRVSALAQAAASSEAEQGRDPLFDEGTYRCKFLGCEERPPVAGRNTWLAIKFEGVGDDEEIETRVALLCTSQKSLSSTGPRVKSLCMALIGMGKDDEEDYNEFDPHGEFIDAITQGDLDAAAAYLSEHAPKGSELSEDEALEALQGAEVIVKVTRGGETDDGGYFRNVSFKPVDGEDGEDSEDDEDERPAKRSAKKKAAPAKGKASKRRPVEDDEDEDEDSDDDSEDDEDEEPESERKPAKKKAKAKGRK
jgi:hypothetical protein